jgi:hypothetical protein
MSRKIKFRGLRAINSRWAYGDVHFSPERDKCHIHENGERVISCPVLPETVGQFTGLLDKNGVEIYEGDGYFDEEGYANFVAWNNERSCWGLTNRTRTFFDDLMDYYVDKTDFSKNVHQHPELLEE